MMSPTNVFVIFINVIFMQAKMAPASQNFASASARQFGGGRAHVNSPASVSTSILDDWTPIGAGDPLNNDPTFQYAPPILARSRPLTSGRHRIRANAFGWPFRQTTADFNTQHAQRRQDGQQTQRQTLLASAQTVSSQQQQPQQPNYPWQTHERIDSTPTAQFRPPAPVGFRHQSLQFQQQQQHQRRQQQSTLQSQVPAADRLFAGVSSLHQQRRRQELEQPSPQPTSSPSTAQQYDSAVPQAFQPQSPAVGTAPHMTALHVDNFIQQQQEAEKPWKPQQFSVPAQSNDDQLVQQRPSATVQVRRPLDRPSQSQTQSDNIYRKPQKSPINADQAEEQRTSLKPAPLKSEQIRTSTETAPQFFLSPFGHNPSDNVFQPIEFEPVRVKQRFTTPTSKRKHHTSIYTSTERTKHTTSTSQILKRPATEESITQHSTPKDRNQFEGTLNAQERYPPSKSSSLLKLPWLSQALGLFGSIQKRPPGLENRVRKPNIPSIDSDRRQDIFHRAPVQENGQLTNEHDSLTHHQDSFIDPTHAKVDSGVGQTIQTPATTSKPYSQPESTDQAPKITSSTTTLPDTTTSSTYSTTKSTTTTSTTTTTTATSTTTTTSAITTKSTTTTTTTAPTQTSTVSTETVPPTYDSFSPFSYKHNTPSTTTRRPSKSQEISGLFNALEQRKPNKRWRNPIQQTSTRFQSPATFDKISLLSDSKPKRRPTVNLQDLLKNRGSSYGGRRRVALSSLLDKKPNAYDQTTSNVNVRKKSTPSQSLTIETDFVPVTTSRRGLLVRRSTTFTPIIPSTTVNPLKQRAKFSSLNRKGSLRRRPKPRTTTTLRTTTSASTTTATPSTTTTAKASTESVSHRYPDPAEDLALSATDFSYKTVNAPLSFTNFLEETRYAPFPISKIHRHKVSRPVIMAQSPTSYARIQMFGMNHDDDKIQKSESDKESDILSNVETTTSLLSTTSETQTITSTPETSTVLSTPTSEQISPVPASTNAQLTGEKEYNENIYYNKENIANFAHDNFNPVSVSDHFTSYNQKTYNQDNLAYFDPLIETPVDSTQSDAAYYNTDIYSRLAYPPVPSSSDYILLDDTDTPALQYEEIAEPFQEERLLQESQGDGQLSSHIFSKFHKNDDRSEPATNIFMEKSDNFAQYDDNEHVHELVDTEPTEDQHTINPLKKNTGSASSWMTGLLSSLFGSAPRMPPTVKLATTTPHPMGALLSDIFSSAVQEKRRPLNISESDEHSSEWQGGVNPPSYFKESPALAGLFQTTTVSDDDTEDAGSFGVEASVPTLQNEPNRPVFFAKRHKLSQVTESGPVVSVSQPFEYVSTLQRLQNRLPTLNNQRK